MRRIKRQRSSRLLAFAGLCGCWWIGCGSTNDVVGFNRPPQEAGGGSDGGELGGHAAEAGQGGATGPQERAYPNLFASLLGKTDAEITNKLDDDYQQIFHGDPTTESVYVAVGTDEAYVWDPRQGDVRSDAFSNALLISVELDRRDEFDKLWRWADAHLVAKSGALRDYVRGQCDTTGAVCADTIRPEPHFSTTTALWLADGRWGSGAGVDYRAAAVRLTAATFRIETGATTPLGALSGMIDAQYRLPRASPYALDGAPTNPSALTPAYFGLWAEKTGDPQTAALTAAARELLTTIGDAQTGLVPDSVSFAGVAAPGDADFSANSYPALIAVALDAVWFENTARHQQEADHLLSFFRASLTDGYAATYTLAGVPGANLGDQLSLEAPVSALAVASTVSFRTEFVQAVWDAKPNTGLSRKFGNTLYLMSSLLLSGRFRVY